MSEFLFFSFFFLVFVKIWLFDMLQLLNRQDRRTNCSQDTNYFFHHFSVYVVLTNGQVLRGKRPSLRIYITHLSWRRHLFSAWMPSKETILLPVTTLLRKHCCILGHIPLKSHLYHLTTLSNEQYPNLLKLIHVLLEGHHTYHILSILGIQLMVVSLLLMR